MNFNPLESYYGLDLSIEKNNVLWNFWEFLKNQVTLSSPSELQKEIIGMGAVADEMAEDFHTYYTLQKVKYEKEKLLSPNDIIQLNELDEYLDERSGDNNSEFWNDELLNTHPDWEEVRKMALRILESINYDNLTIEVERDAKKTKSSNGKSLVIESTKTYLRVKKVN